MRCNYSFLHIQYGSCRLLTLYSKVERQGCVNRISREFTFHLLNRTCACCRSVRTSISTGWTKLWSGFVMHTPVHMYVGCFVFPRRGFGHLKCMLSFYYEPNPVVGFYLVPRNPLFKNRGVSKFARNYW